MAPVGKHGLTEDPLILAVPIFLGGVAAEYLWYRRRSRDWPETAGDYEARDTATSLTMGVVSLVSPLLLSRLLRPFALGRSRVAISVLGGAAGAAVITTVADAVGARSQGDRGAARWARPLASAGGVTTVVLGGVSAAATWHAVTAPGRLWRRRLVRRSGRGVLALALAVLGWDFIYYWNHRLAHEHGFLWAVHVVHHSSERYNLSTALRQPVLSELGTEVPYGLLCLLGISPEMLLRARAINLLYQYWIHTEAIGRLGRSERVLNSPSHHRVHHGSNPRYLDRNYGSILISWDRLFGTFEPEGEPAEYGLTHNVDTFNPLRVAVHEYAHILRGVARSDNWRDRLSHVLKGPGWAYEHAGGHSET